MPNIDNNGGVYIYNYIYITIIVIIPQSSHFLIGGIYIYCYHSTLPKNLSRNPCFDCAAGRHLPSWLPHDIFSICTAGRLLQHVATTFCVECLVFASPKFTKRFVVVELQTASQLMADSVSSKLYPLAMTNSSPWYRWPIEIDGLAIKNGDFPWLC